MSDWVHGRGVTVSSDRRDRRIASWNFSSNFPTVAEQEGLRGLKVRVSRQDNVCVLPCLAHQCGQKTGERPLQVQPA